MDCYVDLGLLKVILSLDPWFLSFDNHKVIWSRGEFPYNFLATAKTLKTKPSSYSFISFYGIQLILSDKLHQCDSCFCGVKRKNMWIGY